QLASMGGKIRPISHNSTGNPELEKEAFALKPGEVSKLIGTPEGIVIFKCDKILPKDESVKLEDVRAKLEAEIIERKVQAEIPVCFRELRKKPDPKVFLKKYTSEEEWLRDIRKELQAERSKPKASPNAN
ncbi:MAG: peptidylprolyl isomerase, partial [Gemmataceae bacterium]